MSKSTLTNTPVAANDSNIAATKPSTLLAQYRAAKDAITNLSSIVGNLLNGQGGAGRRAHLAAYTFVSACMDNPAEAAKLPGWDDAAVQAGTNPCYQPIKMLAADMNPAVQSKISMMAKVYQHAHKANIAPEHFLEHLKRNHGLRRWYDGINLAEKAANGNTPKAGTKKSSTGSTAPAKPKVPPPAPIDIVQRVADTTQIAYAIIDKELLICDSDAKGDLESNPAFLGIVQVANDDCITFLNDNDPRFAMKGAA
ncbi:MAG: hypothetical protein H8E36_09890 [Rhodospirillaceae bacterium]|nr:hypothetical protein [Rhodospirillaceae bacterium]MBL6930699.1 hypothetical protein [Rhodospirillales bacterium]MBL6940523.1 hypothetical protein [Rhodospirillales bacterium]